MAFDLHVIMTILLLSKQISPGGTRWDVTTVLSFLFHQ